MRAAWRSARCERRRWPSLLLLLVLAGCANRPDQVAVSVGFDIPQTAMAKDYAALYAPYAMMATAAYADANVLTANNHCPDPQKLAIRQQGDSDQTFGANRLIRAWIADLARRHWECRFGVVHSLKCPARLGPNCDPVAGLEFFIWRRFEGGRCRDVAIAFRGTDRNDFGDLLSNFRWLARLVPRFDEYDQVRTHMGRVVKAIRAHGCAGPTVRFTAVGHSLGGGLAQQAAYANGTIRYVYAFDPSPVTGFFDVSAIVRERNVRGLGVDRAYESGEILALPRILVENIFPPRACDPRIRTVRFSLLIGTPVQQHNMQQLTERLRIAAKTPGADPRRAEAREAAASCVPSLLAAPIPAPPA